MEVSSPPKYWNIAGSNPKGYAFSISQDRCNHQKQSAHIESATNKTEGFATLMQSFDASLYIKRRIQLSACVKTAGVVSWAGVWMRIDGSAGETLAFDNMHDRPISGDADWWRYAVVLNVPNDGRSISIGALIEGHGQIWFTDFYIETVGEDIPITSKNGSLLREPKNLSFDE